jgi:tRNA pseudouridine32 synthase/23S rRNA pseudouridine746 synthase
MERPSHLPLQDGVSPSCVALSNGSWVLVLDFLSQRLPAVSQEQWLQRMADGSVLDEFGLTITPSTTCADLRLRTAQGHPRIYYYRQLACEPPIPLKERILFQDEHLVVADKPHFLPVTPTGRFVKESLLVRLKQRLGLSTLSPIHRIDRETAGVVVFSVKAQDRAAYQALFKDRLVEKLYEAIAPYNHLSHDHWDDNEHMLYQSRIEPDVQFFKQREVSGPPNTQTHIERVQEVQLENATLSQQRWALYRLKPITGKTHQLRVHMNALGRPILNDLLYPTVVHGPDHADDYARPLQLCAKAIAFQDPITGQERVFESHHRLMFATNSHEI